MTQLNFTQEHHDQIRRAATNFQKAMEVRSGLNLRVAVRVTYLLRIGMISLAVIAVIFLLMLWVMNSRMENVLQVMKTMNVQFISMAQNMSVMRHTIVKMNQSMISVPIIVNEIEIMKGSVLVLNQEILTISSNLNEITKNVDQMTITFGSLDSTVQNIAFSVNRTARPMKLFNQMMPFR